MDSARFSHLLPPAAFERGHCYEPYLQNGNFTTSDPLYGVGAVVQFACDPGHSLEQGPPVIECISARDPYWNDTEPLCKGNPEGREHTRLMRLTPDTKRSITEL